MAKELSRAIRRNLKPIFDFLEEKEMAYIATRTKGSHARITLLSSNGRTKSVFTGGTPSDYRSNLNCIAQIKRVWLELEHGQIPR